MFYRVSFPKISLETSWWLAEGDRTKHVLENILPLLIQTHEQLLDALVGKEVVEDQDDQLQLLVEELRGEESPQFRQVFGLPEETQQRHVELRVIRLKAR